MGQTTIDHVTAERAARGERPDLVGWKLIADALGVTEKTAREWETRYRLPIVWLGSKASAYRDRLLACALSAQRRRAA